MAKSPKYIKPAERHVLGLTVLATDKISPNFLRITVGGESMDQFTPMGYDQWFRIFLPNGDEMRAPTRSDGLWMAEYFLTPKAKRPIGRNLTVRRYRPAGEGHFGTTAELDIDLFIHDDGSTAMASWARAATAGDQFAVLDEGRMYNPPAGTRRQVLAGDDSAMPAVLGIIESVGSDLVGEAFIELGNSADAQDVDVPETFHVNWIERRPDDEPGAGLLDALRTAKLPADTYAFVAGPARLAKDARRLLTKDRQFPRESVTCGAYWR